MWVESFVAVGDQSVALSVERLDAESRNRTAATLAWLTLDAMGHGGSSDAWDQFVSDLLHKHVAFSVRPDRLEQLGLEWWHEAVGRALQQFVRSNELAASINHHLEAIQLARNARRPAS